MNPIRHPSNTRVLDAPAGWNEALPVEPLGITDQLLEGVRCVWSFWMPEPEELAALNAGSPVILSIVGDTMPPAVVAVAKPDETTVRPARVPLAASRTNRVYIAGPMTGIENYNAPAFNAAAAALRASGVHVENPAEHGIVEGATWADYLHYDLTRLATCEAIFLLPGWSESKGARLEAHIALALGMKVLYAAGAERVDSEDELRQTVGEALTAVLAELCEDGTPDWFDSRHVDEVLDKIVPAMKLFASQLPAHADRYLWLRAQHWSKAALCVVAAPKKSVRLGVDCPTGQRLDEAIDAARLGGCA